MICQLFGLGIWHDFKLTSGLITATNFVSFSLSYPVLSFGSFSVTVGLLFCQCQNAKLRLSLTLICCPSIFDIDLCISGYT